MSKPTRRVKGASATPVKRTDEWSNASTGFGVFGRDKRLGSNFVSDVLSQESAENLWNGDDICARIIETVPNEMLRAGHEPTIAGDKELSEEMENEADRLQFESKALLALYQANAFGGAGMLLGVKDGLSLDRPLDLTRIESFDFLNVLTPRELLPVSYFSDPGKPRYGEISTYRLVPVDAPPDARISEMPVIHESRIVRFPGIETSRGAMLRGIHPGWGRSILSRCISVVRDFQASWQGANIILQDFAPATLKLKGLAKLLASASGEGLAERARGIELARSIARLTILDSEEEYKRESVQVSGLSDLLEKLMLRLSAAANMPVSLLMGQSPAGLNASGDADIRWFYDQIKAKQDRVLRPAFKRLYEVAFAAKRGPAKGVPPENWAVKFHPLWQMTALEEATMRKTVADTDQIYVTMGAVTAQNVAMSRFGGDEYSTEMQIDVELVQAMLDDEEMQTKALGAVEEPLVALDPVTGAPVVDPAAPVPPVA